MIKEKDVRECIEVIERIEGLVSSIEDKLVHIAEDLKADLEAIRERDFWEDYQRYMDEQNH